MFALHTLGRWGGGVLANVADIKATYHALPSRGTKEQQQRRVCVCVCVCVGGDNSHLDSPLFQPPSSNLAKLRTSDNMIEAKKEVAGEF